MLKRIVFDSEWLSPNCHIPNSPIACIHIFISRTAMATKYAILTVIPNTIHYP